jgi:uncharacterized membrane protein
MALRLPRSHAEKIVAAIRKAEMKTSGEIKVHIQKSVDGDIMKEAIRKFKELGMAATAERNGVLIFIAKGSRQLTIIGDEGIHSKVGDDFWNEAVATMVKHFKADDFIGGIEAGVIKAGDALSTHFPRKKDDVNELDDSVSVG